MQLKYDFDYNVPFNNDQMGKGDLFIPVTAELLSTCEGIGPVVLIKIRETYMVNLMRVISFSAAHNQMEAIAISHFADVQQMSFRVLQIAS